MKGRFVMSHIPRVEVVKRRVVENCQFHSDWSLCIEFPRYSFVVDDESTVDKDVSLNVVTLHK